MPYMRNGKRDVAKQNKLYDSKPSARAHRAADVKIERELEKAGKAKVGDGKDDDHKKPFSKGGGTELSNIRLVSPHVNRSFSRNSDGTMKKNDGGKRNRKISGKS